MSQRTPVFLDTNVALYLIGNDNPFRPSCARLLRAAAEHAFPAFSDAEVIQEIAYQTSGRGRRLAGLILAEKFMAAVGSILPVTAEDMAEALAILREYERLSPRDAVHLAVMRRHDITHIVTADRHFLAVPGITVLDPHAAAALLAD